MDQKISTKFYPSVHETRKRYLKELHKKRGLNIIAYYSGFWQKNQKEHTDIRNSDMEAFYYVIQGLDLDKGLDLILHTPGGSVAAAERIGNYLRDVFKLDIEVFVPFLAMSAGTMLACASNLIHMGKQSSLGPTDPHFGFASAGFVLAEFEEAAEQIKKDPMMAVVWYPIIKQCTPSFILKCKMAIKLSKEIVSDWLSSGMLSSEKTKAISASKYLNDCTGRKSHSRKICASKARGIGLKITDLEANKEVEELIISIHECFMIAFMNSNALKVVENHNGVSRVFSQKSR